MKKTLSVLALSAMLGLGAVHAQAQQPPAGTPPQGGPDMPPPPGGGSGGPGGPGGHGRFFEEADKNKDGFLTKDEMKAAEAEHTDKMFADLDANKDGKLSKDELKAGHDKMRAMMRERYKNRQGGDKGDQNGGEPAAQ